MVYCCSAVGCANKTGKRTTWIFRLPKIILHKGKQLEVYFSKDKPSGFQIKKRYEKDWLPVAASLLCPF